MGWRAEAFTALEGRHSRLFRLLMVVATVAPLAIPWALSGAEAAMAAQGNTAAAGTYGAMRFERSGAWREVYLAGSADTSDIRFNVTSDKAATGSGQSVVVVARRVRNVGEYRVVVRFTSDGAVHAAVIRKLRGVRTIVAPSTPIDGVTHVPGQYLALRVRVSGAASTAVRIRMWRAATPEPTRWSRVVTDRSAELARSGWLALRFGVPRSSTNVPITYSYDRVRVSTESVEQPPTPQPSPLPTSDSPSPTAEPTATPTTSPAPTATASPTPTATPTPTPTATPTPTPTSTPTPSPSSWPRDSFFVSTSGNDAANGSHGSPWRTLQKAADSVSAGATVFVRQGTFAGFTLRRSGTAAAPITFEAYPGESPVIDGRQLVAYTVRLSGVRHVHLVGLTVKGGFAERHNGGGVLFENSDSVVLRDSLIRDNKAFGIRSYNSTNVVIEDNEITANATGVYINQGGEGTRVTDNLIYDNTLMMVNTPDMPDDDVGAQAIALVRSTGHVLINGNAIWGNRAPSYDYGYDGGAFAIHAASNWTITDNVTWDNRNVLETGTDAERTPCDNGSFTRNLNYGATTEDRTVGMVLRCASDTLVANNTFHGLQHFVFAISHNRGGWGGSVDNLRVVNNIISIATGEIFRIENELPDSVVIDNNLVRVTDGARVAAIAGTGSTTSLDTFRSWTGYELEGIQADPRYMDVTANDYRLRADSPALDVGEVVPGVSDTYVGAGPDLGYRERR